MMGTNWKTLQELHQLEQIQLLSQTTPQIIFKHSTRCSISTVAWKRIENYIPDVPTDLYYLDLLAHRNISHQIAEIFKVYHESPQVLLIYKGECIYDESHMSIRPELLQEALQEINL